MVRNHAQRGFTYFGALFIVALIGLALSGAAVVWGILQQREKEAELLFIGRQYLVAIASYYHAAPGGFKQYPRNISDLLRDPRYPTLKRHLRKPWRDPMTGGKAWGLIYTKQGGIAGIYSLSTQTPLKQKGFGELESLLAGKISYQDWKFVYIAATDTETRQPSQEQENPIDETSHEAETEEDNNEEETGAELLNQPPQQ